MSKLLERLKSQSTIKEAAVLTESKLYNAKDMISTPVPAFNVALSGKLNGGFVPGVTLIAGPSRHFKTGFVLLMIKAYLDQYPDAVVIFYDSEFGTPQSYFNAFGIDTSRILHVPIKDMEELKFDVMNYFDPKNKDGIKRGEKVMLAIDSLGNLASRKEVEDATNEKSVADMTRAKQMKSIFRMITPHLRMKDIPLVGIQHTYQTQEMYSKTVVSGGTGGIYSADTIFIIGRQQDAEGEGAKKVLNGYDFIINVEKSRYVKEKSKIPVTISFTGGMSKWSGLFEWAVEGNFIKLNGKKERRDAYSLVDEDGVLAEEKFTKKELNTADFWIPVLTNKRFQEFVEQKYKLSEVKMLSDDEIADIYDDLDEVDVPE
jgi:RecA/RadA recombinase